MEAIKIERRNTEKRIQTLPGYYAAFAREAKEDPASWLIRPVVRGYELVKIG